MNRPKANDIEMIFPGGSMISETDLKGVITFANRKFVEMTGYALPELIDTPHAILRHPDMPKAAFAEMWKKIEEFGEWNGCVKNLRKDGAFYWVYVSIVAKYDPEGKKVGYIASRKVPEPLPLKRAKELYEKLLSEEKQS